MKAIIWDLDDTIYKQPDNFYQACYQAAAVSAVQHGYKGDVASARETASKSYQTYGYCISSFVQDYSLSQTDIEKTYAQNIVQVVTPCMETLDYMRSFTGPQILVSHSCKPWVDAFIQKFELQDIFSDNRRITSEVIGHNGKTVSPKPFMQASQILGCAPSDITVFEDYDKNLMQANSVGMTTILVTNGRPPIVQPFIHHHVERPYKYRMAA